MNGLSYQEAIDILTSQGKFHIKLGLERVQEVLNLMGNPQDLLKFVHVAGTNGKGSVCSMLSSIFKQNYKVGLFTSPHIFNYTERIKINDEEISKEDFADEIFKIIKISDENNIHLTEFEIITVAAFDYFASNDVEIVVLETGLGGRLDSTNVIKENICSIITNIDLDHTERLGTSIEAIANEKAGIVKNNCPVIISSKNLGYDVVKKKALQKNAIVLDVQNVPILLQEKLALKGIYQRDNLELVMTAINTLIQKGFVITDKMIEDGLSIVKHPCRFEYVQKYNLILDGAHNPNGAKVLRESLDEKFPNQKVRFIFGCLKNKDYELMMKNLFREGDEIYFYQFSNINSASYDGLAEVCKYSSSSFEDFKMDVTILNVVCGSFYMIDEVLKKMGIK